jgi:CubicO group peptidase (beta-lactamase class C family)
MKSANKFWCRVAACNLVWLLTLCPGVIIASGIYQNNEDPSQTIKEYLGLFPDSTFFSVALVSQSGEEFLGFVKTSDHIVSVDLSDYIFEIGSVTKVFTTALLSSLVSDELLELEDKVYQFLSFPMAGGEEINFLHLATHTSGLPRLPSNMGITAIMNQKNPYADYNQGKLEQYLSELLILNSDPGKKYEYSNLGMGLLGYILGLRANSDFEVAMDFRIFHRYHMKNSGFDRAVYGDRLIKGRDLNGNITSNWDMAALAGAGAMFSNVKDLSKFAKAHFSGEDELLNLMSRTWFIHNENLQMGLGWHIIGQSQRKNLLFHNGNTGGYKSCMVIDQENKVAAIILSNISAGHPSSVKIDELCINLLDFAH